MERVRHWLVRLVAGVVALAAVAVGVVFFLSEQMLDQRYAIPEPTLVIPTDVASLEHGEHVAVIRGCTSCHNPNLAGSDFIPGGPMGRIPAPNLTAGVGGIGGSYGDADWVRAIRHGVGQDGEPIIIMPSHEFFVLSDGDLGALIAYLKSVPPVEQAWPPSSVGPLFRVLVLTDAARALLPAIRIDHAAPRPAAPPPGPTAEYGGYLAVTCTGCHGDDLTGIVPSGSDSGTPPTPNLTRAGALGSWSEGQFFTALRTGITPDGRALDPQAMPWPLTARMTEEELRALWLYLQALPTEPSGGR